MDAHFQNTVTKILPVARRPSGVSQALRALKEELDEKPHTWKAKDGETAGATYRIRIATDRASRESAYRLAYQIYQESGYVPANAQGLCVAPYDAQPETYTLLAEDEKHQAVGTISLAFDGSMGLPCDELYEPELRLWRAEGRRLAEVTRLAVKSNQAQSKCLLAGLFSYTSIFARQVRQCTDFVIEVNPRHTNFYRRLLLFQTAGPERPCPRVNGAPAVLMRQDLILNEREMQRVGGTRQRVEQPNERTLFPYFHSWEEVPEIAESLAFQHRPMPEEDRRYFRLPEPVVRQEAKSKNNYIKCGA